MLGTQVELDNQIHEQEEKKERLETDFADLETSESEYSNSLMQIKAQIKNTLTANWAEREMQIKGARQKGSVTETLIADLLAMPKGPESAIYIKTKIEKMIEDLKKTKGQEVASWSQPKIELPANIDEINQKLKKIIASPKLDERDKEIIEIISGVHGHYINDIKDVFQSTSATVCPLCLRSINDTEKQKLFRIVEIILNKDAENFKNDLKQLKKNFQIFQSIRLILISKTPENFLQC